MELENQFSKIISVIGAILIGIGVIWIIAQNWHIMPAALKIITLLVSIAGLIIAGGFLRINEYRMTGNTLLFLASILYTASIFLIAQIFSTSTTMFGVSMLFLIVWVGVIALAYIFEQKWVLQLGMVEFFIWMQLCFGGIIEKYREYNNYSYQGVSPAYYIIVSLVGALLLFSVYKFHKDQVFEKVYKAWAIFYLLLFGFMMTFQFVMESLWTEGLYLPVPGIIFLSAISILAVIIFVISTVVKKGEPKETPAFIIMALLYLVFIIAMIYIPSNNGSYFYNGHQPTFALWLMWIFSNVIYLGILIGIIGYGTMTKYSAAINLAIGFFVLDIISRYIGFMIDFWGYLGLASVFISGGILLIFGGWGIEKWRRNLLKKATL